MGTSFQHCLYPRPHQLARPARVHVRKNIPQGARVIEGNQVCVPVSSCPSSDQSPSVTSAKHPYDPTRAH
jgi:allophanate hydrolase subunit 1